MTELHFLSEQRPDSLSLRLLAEAQERMEAAMGHIHKSIGGKDPSTLGLNVTWHMASSTNGYRELSAAATMAVAKMWPEVLKMAIQILADREQEARHRLMNVKNKDND